MVTYAANGYVVLGLEAWRGAAGFWAISSSRPKLRNQFLHLASRDPHNVNIGFIGAMHSGLVAVANPLEYPDKDSQEFDSWLCTCMLTKRLEISIPWRLQVVAFAKLRRKTASA